MAYDPSPDDGSVSGYRLCSLAQWKIPFLATVDAVENAQRQRRVLELRVLQLNDPRNLIEQYCKIAGESPGSQLPHGVSFNRMIEVIVEHEALAEKSQRATT